MNKNKDALTSEQESALRELAVCPLSPNGQHAVPMRPGGPIGQICLYCGRKVL